MGKTIIGKPDQPHDELVELVLDRLRIKSKEALNQLGRLQYEFLSHFLEASRQAWMLAFMADAIDGDYIKKFIHASVATPEKIKNLNDILGELGVHDLFSDISKGEYSARLADLPIDAYEQQLLKAAGHPKPEMAVKEFLRYIAENPALLAQSREKIQESALEIFLIQETAITDLAKQSAIADSAAEHAQAEKPASFSETGKKASAGTPSTASRKKSKTDQKSIWHRIKFASIGTIFTGVVELAGDAIAIPTIFSGGPDVVLKVLNSLVGGFGGVCKGIQELKQTTHSS